MSIRPRKWTSPDGTKKMAWLADYRDQHGRRQRKAFDSKKEAKDFELRARSEVKAGIHTADAASITVADAGERWIASCRERELEATTINAYAQHIALKITPHLGATKLSALTAPIVAGWQKRLLADGCSAAMARKSKIALGALLADAQENGLVAQNVVYAMGRAKRKANGNRAALAQAAHEGIDIPYPKEIRAIHAKLSGRYKAFLTLAPLSGLRASELRGLRWQNLDLTRGLLHVRQRADRFGVIGPLKTKAARRTVPLMPMVVTVLKEHHLATKAISAKRPDLDLVFPNSKGKPDHLVTIVAGWQAAQVAAGVVDAKGEAKYSGLHALRHFYASWCINRIEDGGLGLLPQRVQERMGHSTITMTMDVYGHLFPAADHAAEMAEAERRWKV
jgi:integrase